MGRLKNLVSSKLSGNVGAMNFRNRRGTTVVAERVYTNASKGDGATEAQRQHRSRLANIVNFYRVIIELEKKAWANRQPNQSFFNMFAKYNLSSSPVFLTKQEAALGAAVIAPYKVSMGALEPIASRYDADVFNVGILLSATFAFANATIGDLATAIVENNPGWNYGDKLSIAIFTGVNRQLTEATIPVVNVKYLELTLNLGDTTALADVANFSALAPAKDANNMFTIPAGSSAAVAVHSRESASQLLASEQFISVNTSVYPTLRIYSSDSQKAKAMDSYGYKPDVLLTPYSEVEVQAIEPAFVSTVTLAGTPLADGSTITEGGALVISGENLSRSTVQVYNGNELYSALSSSPNELRFTINYPGNYRILVNGNLAYSFRANIEVQTGVTSVQIGSNTSTTIPYVNNDLRADSSFAVVIEGADMGALTATGATLSNVGGDASRRTATMRTPSDGFEEWTLQIAGVVVAQGTTSF